MPDTIGECKGDLIAEGCTECAQDCASASASGSDKDLSVLEAELEELCRRVANLEDQQRAHASRQICALMTEIDSLERNVLHRDVTTSLAKKKGLEVLGVDKKAGA